MKFKKIGSIERILISECVKDMPSFAKIERLFALGADPNAVNEIGECVLAIAMEGYCSLYGANLRSGFFAPMLVSVFLENGFDVRRHGTHVISELQNGCYDKHMRRAIKLILKARGDGVLRDLRTVKRCMKALSCKLIGKTKPQAA